MIDDIQVLIHSAPEKVDLLSQFATFFRYQELPRPTLAEMQQRVDDLRKLLEEVTHQRPDVVRVFEEVVKKWAVDDRVRVLVPRLQQLSPVDLIAVEEFVTRLHARYKVDAR